MKKSLHLALSKYNPVPRSLQEASTGKAKTAVDVDLAGLYHHYYLDTYGVEPPSPDPAQFEHLRFLMPCGDFRFQGDGLGASTNARRSKSTELGQAFCRWFMHEHLGIKYFAHIGNLIGPHSAKFHGFAVKRILPGDMPDYLCSAGPGSVMVAEAKGQYTSVSFKNAEFETWRQQFTRVQILNEASVPVSVKGHIVATRFATEQQTRVASKLSAEDPSTEGREPISDETAYSLSRQIAASHYADVLLKLDQPYMAIALRSLISMAAEIRIMATVWALNIAGVQRLFMGGYHGGSNSHPLIEQVGKQIVRRRVDPFRLGGHTGTFVGLELDVFRHLVEICRGASNLRLGSMPEVNPIIGLYSGISMLQDGSIIGPLQLFQPLGEIEL